ncbi:hypothetical protein SUDANB6_00564 [Streptomyces sp. enrichment culture]
MTRSLPGTGARLGAEFIAATGRNVNVCGSADRFAGLARSPEAPAAPAETCAARRYHRGPLRVMYLCALASLICCPASKAYHRRKRSEGKEHKQAFLVLARRRVKSRTSPPSFVPHRQCAVYRILTVYDTP